MKINILTAVLLATFVTGCANSVKPMYDYGEYSESFYAMKRNTGEVSESEWKTSLEDIIQNSGNRGLRVPPGVYANLGYLHLKVNDTEKAISYFKLEKVIYPESVIFMNNLINKVKAQG